MGLDKLLFGNCEMSLDDVETSTISRQHFVEAVDKAIIASRLPEIHPSLAEKLKVIARTNPKILGSAWKVRGECGCPLTEAGVVSFASRVGSHPTTDKENAASNFWISFDNNIGVQEPTLFTVVD